MKMQWLSYPLSETSPRPPAIPAPKLTEFMSIADDGASVQELHVYTHTGTHLDTAAHVIENGIHITDFTPEDLVFIKPRVLDLRLADRAVVMPEHFMPHIDTFKDADILLLRFGFAGARVHEPARFSKASPGLSVPAAEYLRAQCPALRCIGLDVPSLACIDQLDATMSAHAAFLEGNERKMLVIEEMNLDTDLSKLYEVHVHPWLVEGMHSGPCSCIGIFEE